MIDVHLDIGNRVVYKAKLLSESSTSFEGIVLEAQEEYAKSYPPPTSPSDDEDPHKREALILIERVTSVKCIGMPDSAELYKFLHKSNIRLHQLHSSSTPLYRTGIYIKLNNVITDQSTTKNKPVVNPFAIMMGNGNPQESKFIDPPPLQPDTRLDVQLQIKLIEYFQNVIELGFYNPQQKKLLEVNVGKIASTLCMLQKHWPRFFQRNVFPQLPSKYLSYDLIVLITECRRSTTSKAPERLKLANVVSHLTTLSSLEWKAYGTKSMKVPLGKLKEQLANVCGILRDKKSEMIGHNSVLNVPKATVSSTTSTLPGYTPLDEDTQEYYAIIRPSSKKPTQRGKASAKEQAINQSISELTDLLRYSEDYDVFHLRDEQMGIVDRAFQGEDGTVGLSSADRKYYRKRFKAKLADGLEEICINIFGRNQSGSNDPSCLFVWKVPIVHGELHAGSVQKAVEECREMLPRKQSAESILRFNNILSGIAKVPTKVRWAMTEYLFNGESNVRGGDADRYCEFVQNFASGLPVDASWILDGRELNS
jgi:hypothetical protein